MASEQCLRGAKALGGDVAPEVEQELLTHLEALQSADHEPQSLDAYLDSLAPLHPPSLSPEFFSRVQEARAKPATAESSEPDQPAEG